MQDDFVCKLAAENDIIIREVNQKLSVADFKIIFDDAKQTETGSVSLSNKLSETGDYSLHFDTINPNAARHFAPLEKNNNTLGFTEHNIFFTQPNVSGTFYIVCNEYAINNNGTIIISRTISDGIKYTFPE
jgi:hypothetical protein